MPLLDLLEVSGPAAAGGEKPPAAADPAPLTRSDLSAPSLLSILKRKPLLRIGRYPDGTPVIIALDSEWATRAPAGANVWTIEEIALAATVTPDHLEWVHRLKRTDLGAPVTLVPDEPSIEEEFRLAPDGAEPLPEGVLNQIRDRLEYRAPLLYAGYGNVGFHTGTGNLMPVPVYYARDEEARATAPAAAEVWTPEELAYWGHLAPERRMELRRWKEQYGRKAVVRP